MPQKKSFFHGGRRVRFSNLAELPPQRGHTRPGEHHARPSHSTPFPTQTPFSLGEPTKAFKTTKPQTPPGATLPHRGPPPRTKRPLCRAGPSPAQPSGSALTDTAAGGTHGPGQREEAGGTRGGGTGRPPGPAQHARPRWRLPTATAAAAAASSSSARVLRHSRSRSWSRSPAPPAGTPRQPTSEHPPGPHGRRPVDGGSRCLG